jgi:tagaturonate epimerase
LDGARRKDLGFDLRGVAAIDGVPLQAGEGMSGLQEVGSAAGKGRAALESLKGVYAPSIREIEGAFIFMARVAGVKKLLVGPAASVGGRFDGQWFGNLKACPLSAWNASALRSLFPFTAPTAIGNRVSFGTGDRVGLATPGHLRAFKKYQVFPVLAQQSMRELGRTGRTPQEVIDDATFGVFQEGWTAGYAADADHIKTVEEALRCLRTGFTMFTIDAADHIHKKGVYLSDPEAIRNLGQSLGAEELKALYLGKEIRLEEDGVIVAFSFSEADLGRAAATYGKAIDHMVSVWEALKREAGDLDFDFEASVDETETDTLPKDHYFVASELARRGVAFRSLAPKFVGQFQKGIDYIGDLQEFERQFSAHALIARKCGGYKISVHSGSDKFLAFPIVGKYTKGYFHGKTAGTSWLEAVRVAAVRAPKLYRRLHAFALTRFEEDRKSYHVTTRLGNIPDLETLQDSDLPQLLDKADSRQLMHITYGSILSAKEVSGRFSFKNDLFEVLNCYEEDHYGFLSKHMEKHMALLGIKRTG